MITLSKRKATLLQKFYIKRAIVEVYEIICSIYQLLTEWRNRIWKFSVTLLKTALVIRIVLLKQWIFPLVYYLSILKYHFENWKVNRIWSDMQTNYHYSRISLLYLKLQILQTEKLWPNTLSGQKIDTVFNTSTIDHLDLKHMNILCQIINNKFCLQLIQIKSNF